MVLFCKNTPVYNIDTEEVYNHALLPGYMQKYPCAATFKAWFKLRYSSNTNSLARQLKGVTFGQGNRVSINKTTRALSLSDCYWVKPLNDPIRFEQISPYYAPFWSGVGVYKGQSIPTLYVGGYLDKQWVSSSVLEKYGSHLCVEAEVSAMCKFCSVLANNVWIIDGGVAVQNFTNPNYMLEQLDQSGKVDPDDFDESDIIRLFGKNGVQLIVMDAIIGNGDRHAGNLGWIRDANTGAYVCMAPMYDFDHALDSKLDSDRLISDAASSVRRTGNAEYIHEAIRVCKAVCSYAVSIKQSPNVLIFRQRAENLLRRLG